MNTTNQNRDLSFNPYTNADISDAVSEEDKLKPEYLVANIQYNINALVVEKVRNQRAKDFYDGIRNKKDYAFLKEKFGLSNPIQLKFNHLMRPRIDALIAIALGEPLKYNISVKDELTIKKIQDDKKNHTLVKMFKEVEQYIATSVKQMEEAEKKAQQSKTPPSQMEQINMEILQKKLEDIKKKHGKDWINHYEEAAYHIANNYMLHREIHFRDKLHRLIKDFFVTGEAFYRVWVEEIGRHPELDICNSLNLFFNKNINTTFVNEVDRVVHRQFMQRFEVFNKFGHALSEDDRIRLFQTIVYYRTGNYITSGRFIEHRDGQIGMQYDNSGNFLSHDIVEVFHSEWIANNKIPLVGRNWEQTIYDEKAHKNAHVDDKHRFDGTYGNYSDEFRYRQDRYEGYRIAWNIFLQMGKSKHILRDEANPYKCKLSYNGLRYSDENGEPFSMVEKTKDLQDTYDLIHYFRDNLIANSGTKGSRINVAALPKFLGANMMERLTTIINLRKQGVEPIDPTMDGASLFQHYGDFDNSLNGNGIMALNAVLQMIEQTAGWRTGVTPQMLGIIEQREAVTNVEVGIKQAQLMTRPLFEKLRELKREIISDVIDNSQIAYSKGLIGSYPLKDEIIMFAVQPEHFKHSSYQVHIKNIEEEHQETELLKQLTMEFAKGGLVSPDIIIDIIDKPLGIAKRIVAEDARKKLEENNALQQMQQQMQQMQQQLGEYEKMIKQLEPLAKESEQMKLKIQQEKLAIEKRKAEQQMRLEELALQQKSKIDDQEIALKEEVVKAEKMELIAAVGGAVNGNKQEVRNDMIN